MERRRLALAAALGASVVVGYVLISYPSALEGDQSEYHRDALLFEQGKLWWSYSPYGAPDPSAWKAPGYPAWVGTLYAVIGTSPGRLALVQGLLLAPLTVLFTWALARRLFNARVALISAFGIALFPLSWEYIGLLYPEALAIPATLLAMVVMLDANPTPRRGALAGAVIGLGLLIRPNLFFLIVGAGAGWVVAGGLRKGLKATAIATAVAGLVVLPWTLRNVLTDEVGFVPISVQDAAVYGTFNNDAAGDDAHPYAWRAFIDPLPEVLSQPDTSDAELRSALIAEARSYIGAHPLSVAEAFYWNGVTRFWDLRPPARALDEARAMGRESSVAIVGIGLYYLVLPLALLGLWRIRRRLDLLASILALAVAASVTVIAVAGTRYRAPLEPLLVVLAVSAVFRPGRRA